MKLPRGVSAERLIRAVERLGYQKIRQHGSHVRLQHSGPPRHMITIAFSRSMKIGTLHAVLSEVAQMRSVTVESLIDVL